MLVSAEDAAEETMRLHDSTRGSDKTWYRGWSDSPLADIAEDENKRTPLFSYREKEIEPPKIREYNEYDRPVLLKPAPANDSGLEYKQPSEVIIQPGNRDASQSEEADEVREIGQALKGWQPAKEETPTPQSEEQSTSPLGRNFDQPVLQKKSEEKPRIRVDKEIPSPGNSSTIQQVNEEVAVTPGVDVAPVKDLDHQQQKPSETVDKVEEKLLRLLKDSENKPADNASANMSTSPIATIPPPQKNLSGAPTSWGKLLCPARKKKKM